MEMHDRTICDELAVSIKQRAEKLKSLEPSLSDFCSRVTVAADFGHVDGHPGWPNILDTFREVGQDINNSSESPLQAFHKLVAAYVSYLASPLHPELVIAYIDAFDMVIHLSRRQVELVVNSNSSDPFAELKQHYEAITGQEQTYLVSWNKLWLKGLIDIFGHYVSRKDDVTVIELIETYLTEFSIPRISGNDESARRLMLCGMECQQLIANVLKADGIVLIEPVPGKDVLNDDQHESIVKATNTWNAKITKVISKGYLREGQVMKRALVEVSSSTDGPYTPPI